MNLSKNPLLKNPLLRNTALIGAGTIGAVAITFGAAGMAGAQDAPQLDAPDSGTAIEDGTSDADRDERGRRGPKRLSEDKINRLVEDGVITAEQAQDLESIRAAVQEQREAMRAEKAQGIADVLGITVEELQEARESGVPLAELAGDDLEALVAHLVEQKSARIQEKVNAGEIDADAAQEKLDGLAERIQARIENGGGFGGRGPGRR